MGAEGEGAAQGSSNAVASHSHPRPPWQQGLQPAAPLDLTGAHHVRRLRMRGEVVGQAGSQRIEGRPASAGLHAGGEGTHTYVCTHPVAGEHNVHALASAGPGAAAAAACGVCSPQRAARWRAGVQAQPRGAHQEGGQHQRPQAVTGGLQAVPRPQPPAVGGSRVHHLGRAGSHARGADGAQQRSVGGGGGGRRPCCLVGVGIDAWFPSGRVGETVGAVGSQEGTFGCPQQPAEPWRHTQEGVAALAAHFGGMWAAVAA